MNDSMKSNPIELVEAVCQRARGDEKLKAALLADPRGTLQHETGLTIPMDWDVVTSESADGAVHVELVKDQIPEQYLEFVQGGMPLEDQEPMPS